MKTGKLIHSCGSIIKEESIAPITVHIVSHTVVAEANKPYANYYGVAPFYMPTKPNSLFLFTQEFYTLEEVLRFSKLIDIGCSEKLNVAVSVLNFGNEHYPAIRIKNFPDYQKIENLQSCLMEQGVEFAKKVHLSEKALIKTSKCFLLEKTAEGIYLDHNQSKTGYVALQRLFSKQEFNEAIDAIRNNLNSPLFDAARGAMILDGTITDVVRVYSEQINADLLHLIQNQLEVYELNHAD